MVPVVQGSPISKEFLRVRSKKGERCKGEDLGLTQRQMPLLDLPSVVVRILFLYQSKQKWETMHFQLQRIFEVTQHT